MTQPLEFIDLLYGGAAKPKGWFEFRCLPSKKSYWMPYPTFEQHPDTITLESLPVDTEQVYFGVNPQREVAPKGRAGTDAQAITGRLNWVDIDLEGTPHVDGLTKEELLKLSAEELRDYASAAFEHYMQRFAEASLPPRAVVYSGHGLQVYWAGDVGYTNDAEGKAEQTRINQGLCAAFDGDTKSVNPSRILRLPDSYNRKNPERPIRCEIWHADTGATVTRAQLAEYLPEPRPLAEVAPLPRSEAPSGDRQRNYALSGLRREADEVAASQPGGRNHRLNKAAFKAGTLIGAGLLDKSEAIAELRNAAERAGLERDEIDATLRSGLKAGKAKPRDMAQVDWQKPQAVATGRVGAQVVTDSEVVDPVAAPTLPSSGVYVQHGCYYIDRPIKKGGEIVDWYPDQLTNFIWEPSLHLHYPDGTFGERGKLTIRSSASHEMQVEAKAWNSRRDLLDAVGGFGARCITTNNSDIAKIADYIAATFPNLPVAKGVKSYGLHHFQGEWIEVFEDVTISGNPTPPLFYSGTPVDPGSRSFKAPRAATEEQVEEARRGIVKLPQLVTPAVAYALLGYGAASAFSPRITPYLGNRLPFVYVAGERESGKTSGAQVALELTTGYTARLTKASGMTAYQYDIAHSGANNMLALLDEYRPGEIDDGQLRKHHDLGTKWRGSGVASKDLAYELNAPLVVLGEGFTDDAATKSRGVLYLTRKADRGNVDVYSEVLKLPLWAYAGHLHNLARSTTDDEHQARMDKAAEFAGEAIGGAANPRLRYALMYIAYGLLVLQDDTGSIPDEDILSTLREGVYNTLEGGDEGVTNLELFLEQLCFALAKVPNPDAYVTPGIKGTMVLRPRMCVDLVKERYKEQAAISNAKLFNQYAEQAEFFDKGETWKIGGATVRGRRIRLDDIPARCDAGLLTTLETAMRKQEDYATSFS